MKRIRWAAGVFLVASTALLAGCGVQPAGVSDAGQAPTGLGPGVTLYFVDAHERLWPQLRETGRLGTIPEAMSLLLNGPGADDPGVHTEIASAGTTQVGVTTAFDVLQLRVPVTADDVTPLGIDQFVCTALGLSTQSGAKTVKAQVLFTQPTPESDQVRTCPLFSPAG